jgi:hypothetical protein
MFDNLMNAAQNLLGGAATPQQLQGAIADHVGGLDTGELAQHLIGMIPNLPDGARTDLANAVVGALGQHGTSPDDAASAGVPVGDALGGDHAALGALVEHAASDPSSLKDAAIAYVQSNPQIVQQYAPALFQGILSKLGV